MLAEFGMLLNVGNSERLRLITTFGTASLLSVGTAVGIGLQTPSPTPPPAASASPALSPAPVGQDGPPAQGGAAPGTQAAQGGLNIVVLDPAHGGTDLGARGTGGVQESEITMEFASEVRRTLEQQGFQVVETRQGNDNPSFDDRSAIANAQRGAIFITLHIASTGLPGTVRVYLNSDLPTVASADGFIPWDRAQAPFLGLSRKLGDLVQGMLTQRFKGSPDTAQTATIRQLRTVAAPAIAVEVSSVVVNDRADLDHMAQGVADAIVRGVVAFKPLYVVATTGGVPLRWTP
ncbi:MAG TPA: N-acetylmuramoyl-L-alanine amidase [Candidatus Dormibacteraeota bacterium]|nr:N-acetylmuramoyl-L-alanine amidase [Candidatus Dormibacteraeota bacterium]